MIAARVIDARSKMATARTLSTPDAVTTLGGVDQHELYELYAAMDWLVGRQNGIGRRLTRQHLSEHTLLLHDLTSSYLKETKCSTRPAPQQP